MKKKLLLAMCLISSISLADTTYDTKVIESIPTLQVSGLNNNIKPEIIKLYSSISYESLVAKHGLFQDLPIQILDEYGTITTIRFKDIISYEFKPGATSMKVIITGNTGGRTPHTRLDVSDPNTIKLIISLFKLQQEEILKFIQ